MATGPNSNKLVKSIVLQFSNGACNIVFAVWRCPLNDNFFDVR
jgi:hypothetical protein